MVAYYGNQKMSPNSNVTLKCMNKDIIYNTENNTSIYKTLAEILNFLGTGCQEAWHIWTEKIY